MNESAEKNEIRNDEVDENEIKKEEKRRGGEISSSNKGHMPEIGDGGGDAGPRRIF